MARRTPFPPSYLPTFNYRRTILNFSSVSEMAGGCAALLEIFLVIFLGAIEGSRRGDFRSDRAAEFSAGFQCGLGLLGGRFLLRRMKENRGAVLRPEVGSLAIRLRRIVNLPEGVQQLRVTQLRRIEGHLHDFRVPRFIRTHIFVGRVWHVPAA